MQRIFYEKLAFPAERVLIGISGSILATMLAPSILWMRYTVGIKSIRIVMTRQAATMVPPATLAALTGQNVAVDWQNAGWAEIPHVALTRWAEVFIVMPATANILAKAAHGIADDLLSTCLLAAQCPIIFAPVMNTSMWAKPAVQRNIAQLEKDGHTIVAPVAGQALSDDRIHDGAMADVPTILKVTAHVLQERNKAISNQ
jgi:phosphopantothenoylcysteine synthetase/decarboxylase